MMALIISRETALQVIDGFTPDARTTAAAGKLQKLMQVPPPLPIRPIRPSQ